MAALGDPESSTGGSDPASADAVTEVRDAAASLDQPTTERPVAAPLPIPPLPPEAGREPGEPEPDEIEAAAEAAELAAVASAVSVEAAVEAEEIAEAASALEGADPANAPAADLRKRLATDAAGAANAAGAAAKQAGAAAQEAGAAAKEAVKGHGTKARGRLGKAAKEAREATASAASEVRGLAAKGASEARERASNTDMKEFAASTTSLIDTARPFFLAGCAALFALLGFLEGDSGTSQIFAVGAIICVIGAAFSGEINAMLHARAERARAAKHSDG